MAVFTPPTADVVPAVLPETRGVQRLLFRHYGANPRGLSVLMRAGHYVTVATPNLDELAALVDGTTYFLGGHVYTVSATIATLLTADGYGAYLT